MARNRPTSVLVVAVLHLVGGTLGLFCTGCTGVTLLGRQVLSTAPPPRPQPGWPPPPGATPDTTLQIGIHHRIFTEVPYARPFTLVSLGFGLVLDVLLLACGAGLLAMGRWAWFGSIGYAFL